jgi:cobalt/nickel transport system permease protein
MTAVLLLQCFLFNDGGVTALGANIFNMALVAPLCGYGIYRLTRGTTGDLRVKLLAAAFAGWCATVLAAVSCAGQLAMSGTAPWRAVFPAMSGVHMLIGIGEGAITALVLVAIARARPELLESSQSARGALVSGGLVAVGLAVFVAPFACGWPDGLEKVASTWGFEHAAAEPILPAPLPGYSWPGREASPWTTAVVGVAGTLLAFALAWVLARVLSPKESH